MVPSPPLMGQGSLPTSRPTHSRVLFCCPTTSLHRRSPHDRLSQWVQELHGPQWGTAVGQEGGVGVGPTLMGLGSRDPIQTHSYRAMGSWDHFQTHTYGAGGHVTLSRPTLVGLGGMGPHPDP